MNRMTRKSFLLFLGLLGVVPSAVDTTQASSWIGWLCQRLGMKPTTSRSVANCGAYYTPRELSRAIVGYDPACGTGDFLVTAHKGLGDGLASIA